MVKKLELTRYASSRFRSGFIAIFGRPNTGKTTLLNRLCQAKIGIVSPKAQTTRHNILGVRTGKRTQFIFIDTPGYVAQPNQRKLDQRIQEYGLQTLKEADLILLLIDPTRDSGEEQRQTLSWVQQQKKRYLIGINKDDCLNDQQRQKAVADMKKWVKESEQLRLFSAATGTGIFALLRALRARLPFGPAFYDQDTLTDQSSRFLAAELIREQLFLQLQKEVPYGCGVEVESYKEQNAAILIQANIIVDREALKPLILGAKGSKIRSIGTAARLEIIKMTGKKTHLQLLVVVRKNWRNNEKIIKRLGY